MHWIDWSIVISMCLFLILVAIASRKFVRSVVDFLAAGRCAGRYLLTVSGNLACLGAITVIAFFEVYYQSGFSAVWWGIASMPVGLVLSLSGWVIYRYRQTRALTLAQFFEMRYSRRFRIFAGSLMFISGIVNFGIFPAVAARFFLYFCNLPVTITIPGIHIDIPTYIIVMAVLISMSVFFALAGGQVAVIITDFLQGIFSNLIFVIVLVAVFFLFSWKQIIEGLQLAPQGASMLHPFDMSKTPDFTISYFLIVGVFMPIYHSMAWQGNQAYNASAKSAHEAKMGSILTSWRLVAPNLFILLLAVGAFTFMHHPDFAAGAANVNKVLQGIENPQIQKQMIVPLAMRNFLPVGIIGAMSALMIAAFIGNSDTYLHSWGSIFIQDVIIPLRKKTLTPKQHIRFLRWSIIGVAVFIFFFSIFFRQTDYIYMFFNITAGIFLGGAGSVIIGGLYWKRGTTAAAWGAMIIGSVLAVTGIVLGQIYPHFPLNGTWVMFIASLSAIVVYVSVSLLFGKKKEFNLDEMLHRGIYAVSEEAPVHKSKSVSKYLKIIGIGMEFTRIDKIIYIGAILWTICFSAVFIFGVIYNMFVNVSVEKWTKFWYCYIIFSFASGIIITIWFTIGGFCDLKYLLHTLRTRMIDDKDDGRVEKKLNSDIQ
ncbi:MAG: hypothetical protein A2Y13_07080 [Planctomycetes bacterium GWC2_45_44]|nr:MAG: hypothetical protein A2Y13_07080 [Planctomycetes bacterium GWC2_45_44]